MRLASLLGNPQLKAAVGRMTPAPGAPILLDGPAGSGKRTAGRDLIAAMLCRRPDGPCGLCPACRRLAAGSHPDAHVLPFEGKAIKVDQVRDLRARTFLKPQESGFSVFLIEAADRLSPACQNALLKVLEDADGCAFILLCENRQALLQTIRSRCRVFSMEPLEAETVRAALAERGFGRDVSADAVRACGGFLGQALDLLAGDIPPWQVHAQAFSAALPLGELAVLRACLEAGKLSREGYALYLDSLEQALTELVKQSGDSRYIRIYTYIAEQQDLLVRNPSLTALASALAAYCGQTMGGLA